MSDADELERRWRFLLGESGEEERTALEEALFVDDEQLAALQLAEDDLIDAYVRDELSAERRRRFEERFTVTAAQKARVAFASALAARSSRSQVVASAPATVPRAHAAGTRRRWRMGRAWTGAAAALLVATLGGVGWRVVGRGAVPPLELTLIAGQLRGETELPTVLLGARPARLRLILLLERDAAEPEAGGGAPQYDVTLRGPDGTLRTLPASATPAGDRLTVSLDEAPLDDGEYELVARVRRGGGPLRELATYSFRVTHP